VSFLNLGNNYVAEIEVISPLHINSGKGDLLFDIDYAIDKRDIWVIDIEKMLKAVDVNFWNQRNCSVQISKLLKEQKYPECSRYRLSQTSRGQQIYRIKEQLKDPFDRLYIPGSSLKGAIRTCLAWGMIVGGGMPITKNDFGRHYRFAAQPIEAKLFGQTPNHDLLRALHVADSESIDIKKSLNLYLVSVYSISHQTGSLKLNSKGTRFRFHVEAVPPQTMFRTRLRLDKYLLQNDFKLQFSSKREKMSAKPSSFWLIHFARHCNAFAEEFIKTEIDFYADYGLETVMQFYEGLRQQLFTLDREREFLLQLGWGTGWLSKTIGMALSDELLDFVRSRFRLGRRGAKEFPKSRRLIEINQIPKMPLGWIKVKLEQEHA